MRFLGSGFGVSGYEVGQTTEDRRQRTRAGACETTYSPILCPLSFVFCLLSYRSSEKNQISSCGQIRNMINC